MAASSVNDRPFKPRATLSLPLSRSWSERRGNEFAYSDNESESDREEKREREEKMYRVEVRKWKVGFCRMHSGGESGTDGS